MAGEHPDWFRAASPTNPFDPWGDLLAFGNDELAARLGSPQVYDRRGHLYLADTFEAGLLLWTTAVSGAGAGVALDDTTAVFGKQSVKLTTGRNLSRYARITLTRGVVPLARVGIEVSFSVSVETDMLEIVPHIYTSVYHHLPSFLYKDAARELYIVDEGDNEVKVADASKGYLSAKHFCNLKCVFDTTTGKYVRLLFNGIEYDISAYAYEKALDATGPYIFLSITNWGKDGENNIVNVDSVIITVAEPD